MKYYYENTSDVSIPLKLSESSGMGVWLVVKSDTMYIVDFYSGDPHLFKVTGRTDLTAEVNDGKLKITDTNGWWGRWLIIPWK